MYDVIVIGARCAGSSTAMLLARKGYRVLVVDRATFPSDIPHGHAIHKGGPARLARWGLLDRLVAGGCPQVTSTIADYGDFPLAADGLIKDGVPVACAPRRFALDALLVDAAVEAGAEVRAGYTVEGFLADDDTVQGVRMRGRASDAPITELARVTVGADGRRSRLAEFVRAPAYEESPSCTCWYFSYFSDVPRASLEVYARRDHAVFAFPTNDGLLGVFVCWAATDLPRVRADIEGSYMAAVDGIPELSAAVRAGRRVERFRGATDVPNFLRRPHGPGWALVGDAGCHKDPFLALGICDAFRDAELLAGALDDGLSGRRPLDEALADYERKRNEATMPDFRMNLHLARFRPPPDEFLRIRAAVRGDAEATRHFAMAFQGMVPRESFFNPDNLQRLMASAANTQPMYSPAGDASRQPARPRS